MKIRFIRTICVDVIGLRREDDITDKTFQKNSILEIVSIDPVSDKFVNIILVNGDVLLDVREDSYEPLP